MYAHELGHHWFGNLVTCLSADDMWINEGWATYCEAIFTNELYGSEAFKNYVRNNHKNNLQYLHITDYGYKPIYGLDNKYTYSSTIYNKGADVVHTLHGYMGDTAFFTSVKEMLQTYAFKNISTYEFKNFWSNKINIDLTDFFNGWVYTGGWAHFSIDSFSVNTNSTDYDVTVYVHQKLKGRTTYINSNRIPITFMDNLWNTHTDLISFSGATVQQTFKIPFIPSCAMLDIDEKISDATTDNYKIINTIGEYNFNSTYFIAEITSISDSAFIRVEHNWAPPSPLNPPVYGLIISDNRYWKIDGVLSNKFKSKGKFYYNRTTSTNGYLDNTLIKNPAKIDSLVILFRPNSAKNWIILKTTRQGTSLYGYLITDTLPLGEYTLGIWDYENYNTYYYNNQFKNFKG